MRSAGALLPDELARLETWVKLATGAKRLWQQATPEGTTLNHHYAQLVGASESGPRPHTDSRKLCRYAAVIYLLPDAPARSGTSFYWLRYPNGALGGNLCTAPHCQSGPGTGPWQTAAGCLGRGGRCAKSLQSGVAVSRRPGAFHQRLLRRTTHGKAHERGVLLDVLRVPLQHGRRQDF